MKGINTKELCKQIKKSKNHMIWSNIDGVHYITNRHWMVRYNDIPRDVLVTLFSIFVKIPEPGKSMQMVFGDPMEREAVKVDKIYDSLGEVEGEVTPYMKDMGISTARIIKCDSYIIHVNENFMRLLDSKEPPMCSGEVMPVSFLGGSLIILPLRTSSTENHDEIQEILAS